MNYCKIQDCHKPIENKDTGLCATHSKEQRKASQVAIKKPIAYKIPQLSKKGAQRKRELTIMYGVFDNITPRFCSNCGSPHELTHSHILPQGQYKAFAADIRNLVFDCYTCHNIYEHGDLSDCEQLKNWPQRLAIIYMLSGIYFFRRFGILLSDYMQQNPEIELKTRKYIS